VKRAQSLRCVELSDDLQAHDCAHANGSSMMALSDAHSYVANKNAGTMLFIDQEGI
jgi:hypothetical protein